jgi:hypothetical protein
LNIAPTEAQAGNSDNIDWAGITAGTALAPDITIPPGSWPSFTNPNYWPTILVNGNYTLPGNGQGTLIVTGSLTMNGSVAWSGVLLVGDNITSNGNNSVSGATVSGLNVKLGVNLPQGERGERHQAVQLQFVQRCRGARQMVPARRLQQRLGRQLADLLEPGGTRSPGVAAA